MGFVISVQQEKGGVSKTTTSVNLAAGIARAGLRTLLIDFDPGAADSRLVGAEVNADREPLDELLVSGR